MLVAQSCPTLRDPMDCRPPSSSVHGILQARKLEWVALPFSMRLYQSRDQTFISYIAGGFFTSELPGKTEESGVHGVAKIWIRLSDFTFTFTREDKLYETSAWAPLQISIEVWLLLPIIAFYYFFSYNCWSQEYHLLKILYPKFHLRICFEENPI